MKLNLARSEDVNLQTFSGAFAKFRRVYISFIMSVQLSVRMKQFGSKWKDFQEILYLNANVEKIQVSLQPDNNNGLFERRLSMFITISR